MSPTPQQWQSLEKQLSGDFTLTTQLHELLIKERESLEARDYDAFQHLIGQKARMVAALENGFKQRQEWLTGAGFSNESDALKMARSEAPAATKRWTELAEQWEQCQHQNTVNERIALRTKLVVGHMLDMLRGQNSRQRLYNASGSTTDSGGGSSITRA